MNSLLKGIAFQIKISRLNLVFIVVFFFINLMTLTSPLLAATSSGLTIEKSWIRQAPPNANMLVAYLELNNTSNQDWTLVNVSSSHFKKIEIHRSILEQGIARMEQRHTVKIPAHQKIIFKSGSFHLMLIKPVKRLKTGEKVLLNFVFDNGKAIRVNMEILKRKKPNKN